MAGFTFTHAGRSYTIAPWREWPMSVTTEIFAGRFGALADVIGGQDVLGQLMADGFTNGQLMDVLEQVAAAEQPAAAQRREEAR